MFLYFMGYLEFIVKFLKLFCTHVSPSLFHWVVNYPTDYAKIVRALYHEGFKIILWEPNLNGGTKFFGNLFSLFEIAFRRTDLDHNESKTFKSSRS